MWESPGLASGPLHLRSLPFPSVAFNAICLRMGPDVSWEVRTPVPNHGGISQACAIPLAPNRPLTLHPPPPLRPFPFLPQHLNVPGAWASLPTPPSSSSPGASLPRGNPKCIVDHPPPPSTGWHLLTTLFGQPVLSQVRTSPTSSPHASRRPPAITSRTLLPRCGYTAQPELPGHVSEVLNVLFSDGNLPRALVSIPRLLPVLRGDSRRLSPGRPFPGTSSRHYFWLLQPLHCLS